MNIKSKKSLIIIIITALLGGISYFTFNPIEISHSFRHLKTLAEQGDAVDQYNLGVMYYDGESTPKNYNEAFKWFKKSAEQGYASAQYKLGNMYNMGKGTTKNYQKAFEWMKKSAEQGYAEAQYSLGGLYNWREGSTPKNPKKLVELWKKSAEQGYAKANYGLGVMYYDEIAIDGDSELPINNQKAYTHFLICDYLEYKQDTVKELINELEQKLTPQAITNAQNEAENMIQGFKKTDD